MTEEELVVEDKAKDLFSRARDSHRQRLLAAGVLALSFCLLSCNAPFSDSYQVPRKPLFNLHTLLILEAESDQPLIHANAGRLFQKQINSEEVWST
jgi:hypothetical protein